MTTPGSGTVYISTHDLQLGLAKRPCPYCDMPVLIRLPSMADAIADQESAALRLGLTALTQTEQRIFDAIYLHYPRAVPTSVVSQNLDDMAAHTIEVNVGRMRPKLTQLGWELICRHGSLRLNHTVVA